MRTFLIAIILLWPMLLPGCPPSNPPPAQSCCGDSSSPGRTVDISPLEITTNVDEVPIELIGCRWNQREITKITIDGKLAGCASRLGESEIIIKFPILNVTFTDNGSARCGTQLGQQTHQPVVLVNVVYRYKIRINSSPTCISWSDVTWASSFSDDTDYNKLFIWLGPQTMLPILDRYVLGWIASTPATATCPPTPIFRGNTSRCPGGGN